MTLYYPDISHYHPVSNWDTVKKSCPFLITKATQGTSYIDPTLTRFIAECENRGIPYWLYTYLNKGNELAQTKFLVQVCGQRIKVNSKHFMGYILDVEAGNAAANVKAALDWLNKQGKKTMLYTMYAEYSRYKDVIAGRGSDCAWWEARYGANNGQDTSKNYPCHSGVDLHQYTSKGFVPGLGSNIDLNRMVGKKESWFTGGMAAAAGAVTPSTGSSSSRKKTTYSGILPALPPRGFFQIGDGITTLKNYPTQIKRIQMFLNWAVGAKLAVDGQYGPATTAAVNKFKEKVSLKQDGCWNLSTLKAAKAFEK